MYPWTFNHFNVFMYFQNILKFIWCCGWQLALAMCPWVYRLHVHLSAPSRCSLQQLRQSTRGGRSLSLGSLCSPTSTRCRQVGSVLFYFIFLTYLLKRNTHKTCVPRGFQHLDCWCHLYIKIPCDFKLTWYINDTWLLLRFWWNFEVTKFSQKLCQNC